MRHINYKSWINLLLVLCMGLGIKATAQTTTSVEYDLETNAAGDSLRILMKRTGEPNFTGLISSITYTLRWPASSTATLGAGTQFCPGGGNQQPYFPQPMVQDGFQYQIYLAFGTNLMSNTCPGQNIQADQWTWIHSIKIENTGGDCILFEIADDAFTVAQGGDPYVALDNDEFIVPVISGAYIGDPNGACAPDCLGQPGGSALVDDCGQCYLDGPSDPLWNTTCADCAGVANGSAFIDECGTCAGGTTGVEACVQDCAGTWGGDAQVDDCNVCYQDGPTDPNWNTTCLDCNGVVNGTAFIDDCEVCVGGNTGLTPCGLDCAGVAGGTAYIDNCGVCVGGTTGEMECEQDCNNVWGGTAFVDDCGDCVGGNTGADPCEQDCLGVFGGPDMPGTACSDPGPGMGNGIWNSDCICVGQIVDCAGEPGGSAFVDNCGDCVGGTTGEVPCEQDCLGVWGGNAMVDDCNVCYADGSADPAWNTTCLDCNGDVNGTAFLDDCGVCVGGNTGLTPCGNDCAGVPGGTAYLDNCGVCVGGTTGEEECTQDCNNVWGGVAFLDDCGNCVGGNTGNDPCEEDCLGVLGGTALPGTVCDPGMGFINGIWNADCICIGTPVEIYDCPDLEANFGDMCDPGPGFTDGEINADCECVGTPVIVYDCPDLEANFGDMCDPGPGFTDGEINSDCECVGTPVVVYDCPALQANIGDICDPGPGYTNGSISANCECVGEPVTPGCSLEVTAEWGCLGESNGWAVVEYAGASGSISILWSTGETVQYITGLASGEHWVMVTDAAGCFVKYEFSVDCEKDCDLETVVEWGCLGESNGWASVDHTGGTNPISILWSTGEVVQFITGLASGDHWVTVSDAEGCSVKYDFTVDCEKDEEPCELRTQTQGGWGSPGNGNNPGAYRNANFAGAFPGGLTVGCTKTLTLTSAAAVQQFLPSGGQPNQLAVSLTNPNNYNNVLAGQLVALTLSVGFDNYDPDFGSGGLLADAVINTGTFEGWTVQELLDEANSFIGGCGSMYTASQLNNALSMVNENFVGGTTNQGNVDCAPSGGTRLLMDESASMAMRAYPVPANNTLNLDLMFDQTGDISLIMMDAVGRVVMQQGLEGFLAGEERTLVLDVNALGSGTYLLTVLRDGVMLRTERIVVSH